MKRWQIHPSMDCFGRSSIIDSELEWTLIPHIGVREDGKWEGTPHEFSTEEITQAVCDFLNERFPSYRPPGNPYIDEVLGEEK